MKTKPNKTPAPRRARSVPLATETAASLPTCEVRLTAHHADFPDGSRLINGPEGTHAAEEVAAKIAALKATHLVTVIHA